MTIEATVAGRQRVNDTVRLDKNGRTEFSDSVDTTECDWTKKDVGNVKGPRK